MPALPEVPSTQPGNPFKPASSNPLKLYQPAHQRYYLITANLVCRVPGFPDKATKIGEEKVSFVLRRNLETEKGDVKEHAFVNQYWQLVESLSLLPGEEQFPLFPTTYQEQGSRRRRMFSGLIPVGERERYLTAPRQPVDAMETPDPLTEKEAQLRDRLMMLLMMDVLVPWDSLLSQTGDYTVNEVANNPKGLLTRTIRRVWLMGIRQESS